MSSRLILSGARGVLEKVDAASGTLTLKKESGRLQFDCDAEMSLPAESNGLLGKIVDLVLCDFLVIGITESSIRGPDSIEEGQNEC